LLHQQHVFDKRFLPYGSQLIPLAAIPTVLGNEITTIDAQQRLARWLWCGIFGELYGGTIETRFARDVPDVVAWVRGSSTEPRAIDEAQFAPGRLDTLRSRNSAAYKGIYALLMKRAADWHSGELAGVTTYFDEAVDIHHIFPRAWCDKQSIPASVYNSILNKTPLTARTNRVIGGYAPSEYMKRLASGAGVPLDAVVANVTTHLVDTEPLLAGGDFATFMDRRRIALLGFISGAMGKVLETGASVEDVDEPFETDDDLEDA